MTNVTQKGLDWSERTLWRGISTAAALAAAGVAHQALGFGWRRLRGAPPPTSPESPEIDWREAAVWVGAVGLTIALTKLLVARTVAATWRRKTGHFPPGLTRARAGRR